MTVSLISAFWVNCSREQDGKVEPVPLGAWALTQWWEQTPGYLGSAIDHCDVFLITDSVVYKRGSHCDSQCFSSV